MALKSLICPQCGAKLEFDDADREYGFCTYCGTKVQLHEIVSVKHSGSVILDNSAQANNRVTIANRAFDARNYHEAINYYTKALEDKPNDFVALYRKGICTIYNSSLDAIRSREFVTLMNAAITELGKINDTGIKTNLKLEKDRDIESMLNTLYAYAGNKFGTQANRDDSASIILRLGAILMFAQAAIKYVELEEIKERVLLASIKYADEISKMKIPYVSKVYFDKNGKTQRNYDYMAMAPQQKNQIAEVRQEFANVYNNLPSRVARDSRLNNNVNSLNADVNALKEDIKFKENELKAAKASYWKADSSAGTGLKKATLPSLILLIISIVFGIVLFIISPLLGIVFLGITIYLSIRLKKNETKKYEKENLPQKILQQQHNLENEKEALKEKEKILRNRKQELNTFNKSKK